MLRDESSWIDEKLPRLVICGTCGYSVTHKKKEWQGCAAIGAAVYAKNLLARIPVNKLEAERRISDTLSSG